jgi:hypothetical protein
MTRYNLINLIIVSIFALMLLGCAEAKYNLFTLDENGHMTKKTEQKHIDILDDKWLFFDFKELIAGLDTTNYPYVDELRINRCERIQTGLRQKGFDIDCGCDDLRKRLDKK